MFQKLDTFTQRPEAFSRYTTDRLWTDPHIAGQMLRHHLDENTDAASRRPAAIDSFVDWIDRRFGLGGMAVLDLGCGPGLYAIRMAGRGARVTGVDFSASSLDYAREAARAAHAEIDFRRMDYLLDELPGGADLITLIYADYCAIGPDRRRLILDKVRRSLAPGGRFVFDVSSVEEFAGFAEAVKFGRNYMNGFWSSQPYFAFHACFRYEEQAIALDRYLVCAEQEEFEIYNWVQYFTPTTIAAELGRAGFECEAVLDLSSGEDWRPSPQAFAVVARSLDG